MKLKQSGRENTRLQQLIREKESKILESEAQAKELTLKASEFEEMFNGQLEIVKALQSDLNVAYEENKALVKEMDLLNEMFRELERTHVVEALKSYTYEEVDLSDAAHKDDKGKVVGVTDIMQVNPSFEFWRSRRLIINHSRTCPLLAGCEHRQSVEYPGQLFQGSDDSQRNQHGSLRQ